MKRKQEKIFLVLIEHEQVRVETELHAVCHEVDSLHNDHFVPVRGGLTSPSIALIQLSALCFPSFDTERQLDH